MYIETDNGSRRDLYRGYGAVVEFIKRDNESELRQVAGMCYGSLNLAYILALTDALDILIKRCMVTIYAYNDHVCGSICNGRVNEWRLNGWRTAKMEPVANADEWRELFKVASKHELYYVHIRGKGCYHKEIQNAIKEVRDKGVHWQQMQLT